MSQTIAISQKEGSVLINNLTIKNADFMGLLLESPESQTQIVQDVIAVGTAAMQRVRTTIDVDFVEKRFTTLTGVFQSALSELERRATDALSQRFSPSESGSYTKQLTDLIAGAQKDVQSWHRALESKAESLFDPDKKTSATGKLDELVRQAKSSFEQMFDPNITTSYAYRLNQQLSQVFGTNGHSGVLQAALQESLKPVFSELHDLKAKVESKKAAEEIIEASTLKGKPFEDIVQDELSSLARPYSDDVQFVGLGANGSRAGDFLITLAGLGRSIVVEARNRKQGSLPAIKADLDREIKARAADLAIYVTNGPEQLPLHVGGFQIYGNKIVTTIETLHIAYRLARVLAAIENPEGPLDLGSLRDVLAKIKDAASSLRKIKTKATQVEKLGQTIGADAEGTEDLLFSLIESAEKLLTPKPVQSIGGLSESQHAS